MKKQYWNTLIALAVLLLLWGGATYWEKRKGREVPASESTASEKLLSIGKDQIDSLRMQPREGQGITCRREGANWRIVEPRKLPADQDAVDGVLNSLSSATIQEVVAANPSSVKEFGLDPPAAALEVSAKGQPNRFTLQLGDETPTGGGLYAKLAGSPRVFTLASYLKSSLEKSLFDLRDKRVTRLPPDQIQRIEVVSKKYRWGLLKDPEGVWHLNLPPEVRTDRFAADGALDRLRTAKMQSVVAEQKGNDPKYGFGVPALNIRMSGPGGRETLLLGRKQGKDSDRYFAMNTALEPVFTLGSDFLTEFQKNPDDLREKDLFLFSTSEVKRVEVETPKGHWVFEQQGGKWKQTTPAAKEIPADKMDTLLSRLRDLRAESFPKGRNLAALGLARPAYRFQVQFGEKNEKQVVEAAQAGAHSYARRTTDLLASELSKNALADLVHVLEGL